MIPFDNLLIWNLQYTTKLKVQIKSQRQTFMFSTIASSLLGVCEQQI